MKVSKKCKELLIWNNKFLLCEKSFLRKWMPTHFEWEHSKTEFKKVSIRGLHFLTLDELEKVTTERNRFILFKSPEQYHFMNSKHLSDETRPPFEYVDSIVVFDELLGARRSPELDTFFTRWRVKELVAYFLSQSLFD